MTQPAETAGAPRAPRFGPLYRSLLVSVAIPLAVAQWLLHSGWSTIAALGVAALFPLADGLLAAARRRIDFIGIMSLVAIVLGIALSFFTGNAVFAVAKESFFTVAFGLVFLGSLVMPRPLIFHLGRQFNAAGDPAAQARWDANWAIPGFRRVIRRLTAGWGLGLIAEAALRVAVAFALPPATAIVVSPLIAIAAFGALIWWTRSYTARARRRAALSGAAPQAGAENAIA